MGLDGVQVSAAADEEGAVKVNLSGDNLGIVIGRRGETLDAIQYLTSLAVNRACGEYRRVTIAVSYTHLLAQRQAVAVDRDYADTFFADL